MSEFMGPRYLLANDTAVRLYNACKDLPIIDYHCHLSPKEIYEDREFSDIGEMFLGGDHYKWRLMRCHGIDEKYITGDASWGEKFQKYAEALATAAGNPLYHWTHMELRLFFGIDTVLNGETAGSIRERANAVIREKHLSPRKLITGANVEYLSTTDDPADTLEYHKLIAADKSFATTVTPAFRPDALLSIRKPGYTDYIARLSAAAELTISDFAALKQAVSKRLDYFCSLGCRFTDVGIEGFPSSIGTEEEAAAAFAAALKGKEISDEAYDRFLGYCFVWLAGEYKKHNLVMQWHLGAKRNASTRLFHLLGADCGGDCVGDPVPVKDVCAVLDRCEQENGLPKTILYSLNGMACPALAAASGSFRGVICGAAWWFCDHKRGIIEQIENIAEVSDLSKFLGMLTDSRSFLSYARHDYFRRIFASVIGQWIEDGEFVDDENALKLVAGVYHDNLKNYLK